MHIVLAGLYSCTIYLAVLAYLVIVRADLFWPAVLGPFVISGLIVALIAAELALSWLAPWVRRAWRSLATVRLRRSTAE